MKIGFEENGEPEITWVGGERWLYSESGRYIKLTLDGIDYEDLEWDHSGEKAVLRKKLGR